VPQDKGGWGKMTEPKEIKPTVKDYVVIAAMIGMTVLLALIFCGTVHEFLHAGGLL
jgi:energy-coupling factor transporter transmembrane protein EcfT